MHHALDLLRGEVYAIVVVVYSITSRAPPTLHPILRSLRVFTEPFFCVVNRYPSPRFAAEPGATTIPLTLDRIAAHLGLGRRIQLP